MNAVIIGAGALGGYFASRFRRADMSVTLLARGERYRQLQARGLRVEDAYDGNLHEVDTDVIEWTAEATTAPASGASPEAASPVVPPADLVLITVRASQVKHVVTTAGRLYPQTPIVCIGSLYPDDIADTPQDLGERLFAGFPGCAAMIDEEGTVLYTDHGEGEKEIWGLTLGTPASESGGDTKSRRPAYASLIGEFFTAAGIPVHSSPDINSVLLSQLTVRLPLLSAVKLAGGSLDNLYVRGDLLKLMILGTREALAVLKAGGYTPIPASLEMYRWVPVFITANMIKQRFDTLTSRLGIEEFAGPSVRESAYLASRFFAMAERLGGPLDNLASLFSTYPDPAETDP